MERERVKGFYIPRRESIEGRKMLLKHKLTGFKRGHGNMQQAEKEIFVSGSSTSAREGRGDVRGWQARQLTNSHVGNKDINRYPAVLCVELHEHTMAGEQTGLNASLQSVYPRYFAVAAEQEARAHNDEKNGALWNHE